MTEYKLGPIISAGQMHRIEWHPEWQYTKTWVMKDDAGDLPVPEGEGWVRNVEAGDGGQETLERIRVAYWRRPKS
jgi:hypothetical protein